MKKKVLVLLLIVCLLVGVVSPVMVRAQPAGIAVTASTVTIQFPFIMDFAVDAQSSSNITDIRLEYTVSRASFAQVISEGLVEFTPSISVTAHWSWDMRLSGGLPPGTTVNYWWKLTDAAGGHLETAPAQVMFNDTRYNWRSLTQGLVTMWWYQGDTNFANQLMQAAQQALVTLEKSTGAKLMRPVRLYIYASSQDLQGAMIFPQEWTGGVTFTGYDAIAIGIPTNQLSYGLRTIVHELTHLVINQVTDNPYNDLPPWLDEGLAMYGEGPLEPAFSAPLNSAIAQNRLTSVRSLASPFSAFTQEAVLDYAESFSIVQYLIITYGQPKMLEILNTFHQGSTYDGALLKVYGFDMDGLNTLWRKYIKAPAAAFDFSLLKEYEEVLYNS